MFKLCMCKTKDCDKHDITFSKLILAPVMFVSLVSMAIYNLARSVTHDQGEPYTKRYDHAVKEIINLSPMFVTWVALQVTISKTAEIIDLACWVKAFILAF